MDHRVAWAHAEAAYRRDQPRYSVRYRTKMRKSRNERGSTVKLAFIVALAITALVFLVSSLSTPASPESGVAGQGFASAQGEKPPDCVIARNVYMADLETQKPLFERNSTELIAPASTAKMATALTVLDVVSPDEVVRVGEEIRLIDESSSRAWLTGGDVLTVRQLLIALMLPSGNDAAYALAAHAGRRMLGDEDAPVGQALDEFMARTNETVEQLGAHDTHLVVPDGFDADGQHTTARDLAVLAKACLEQDLLSEIVAMSESTEVWPNGARVTFANTDQLVDPDSPYYLPGALGVKTGSTPRAGACLVSAARIQGRTLICVVMGSEDEARYSDSIELYNAASERCS